VLTGGRVRLASEGACPAQPPVYTPPSAAGFAAVPETPAPPAPKGFWERLKSRLKLSNP